MRRTAIIALLLGVSVGAGCEPATVPGGHALNSSAAVLDQELIRMREAAVALAAATADLYADPEKYSSPRFPQRRYRFFEGTLYYYQGGRDESSALMTGAVPVGEVQQRELRRLEHLDGLLRAAASLPGVAMAWVATGDSAAMVYPSFDVVAYVPPGMDLPVSILPYWSADPAHNPARVPVWVEPYVDVTGKGYLVTVSVPVYRGAEMTAVASVDVDVVAVARRVLSGTEVPMLLLTGVGFLAGITEVAGRDLGLEALGRLHYLRQVEVDVPAPERFRLSTHADPAIRDLATRVLRGENRFSLVVANRCYRVMVVAVPEPGWFLVELAPAESPSGAGAGSR